MSYCHKLSYPKFHLIWNPENLTIFPNTIQHTVPITPPNTPSKATLYNRIMKTPVSSTPKSNFQRISKQVVMYNFHNEIDDAELLKVDCDQVCKLPKTKTDVTEHMSYWLISWHISVVYWSMVFGMTKWATCKVYGTVKIYAYVYISNIYILCKWHTQYIIVYVQVWYTRVDLCKRYKHRAWNKI